MTSQSDTYADDCLVAVLRKEDGSQLTDGLRLYIIG